MLNIINDLKPFFEDCYRRINVREYARLAKISPPTASKMLEQCNKEGLLISEKDKNYIFYYANKNNSVFRDLSRIYWKLKLTPLTDALTNALVSPTIVLFGSLSKAETKEESDIDLCILGNKKEFNLEKFEHTLKRKIQIFFFNSVEHIKNKELATNILNGYVLEGRLKI